jgi:hypothetical protein
MKVYVLAGTTCWEDDDEKGETKVDVQRVIGLVWKKGADNE